MVVLASCGRPSPPGSGPVEARGSDAGGRATGAGSIKGGEGIAFDLDNVGDPTNPSLPTYRKTYDVSALKGVTFKAKGNASLHFAVATADVIPVEWKGTCLSSASDDCDRAHQATITLRSEWQAFTIPFAILSQPGVGPRIPFDPRKAIAMRFFVSAGPSFDISVDDLGFYK